MVVGLEFGGIANTCNHDWNANHALTKLIKVTELYYNIQAKIHVHKSCSTQQLQQYEIIKWLEQFYPPLKG